MKITPIQRVINSTRRKAQTWTIPKESRDSHDSQGEQKDVFVKEVFNEGYWGSNIENDTHPLHGVMKKWFEQKKKEERMIKEYQRQLREELEVEEMQKALGML